MVVTVGPGKFYGSSLPRPRIYTDVKFNDDRVDPPVSVLDPLLDWAIEAHWSMGGLSFKRLRLQGRIEGSVKKLQAERESVIRKQKRLARSLESPKGLAPKKVSEGKRGNSKKRAGSPSPPPAPIAAKRRRYMALFDDEESEEEEEELKGVMEDDSEEEDEVEEEVVEEVIRETKKKKPVRKLYDEFNKVATESEKSGESNGASDAVMKVVDEVNKEHLEAEEGKGRRKGRIPDKSGSSGGTRTSPRLSRATESSSPAPSKTKSSRRLVKRG